ncbi:tail fiber protein [Primorskyibacter aestuariivivens]|uniref:phage tail protein n=1 Tax=Primorskyibacter aestuariivivens TaxID=1888912 RepID=UPI0023003E80|nr:tail fiber protein [Primorskyibacter aestuariivivens]MDA7429593.1 tail fiber protein [Primorskyibacter aestuariivivens]
MFKKLILAAALSVAGFFSAPHAAQAQDYWIGQIVIGGWNFCPRTTVPANGQLLPINQNQALFSLYGTTFGGDGRTTFALPDLRGRIAMHNGQGPGLAPVALGARGGRNDVTLNQAEMPNHTHTITNTVTATANVGGGGAGTYTAGDHITASATVFSDAGAPSQPLADGSVAVNVQSVASNTGGNQSFNIANPFLGVQFCVVQFGIFPSRS